MVKNWYIHDIHCYPKYLISLKLIFSVEIIIAQTHRPHLMNMITTKNKIKPEFLLNI